MFDEKKYSKLFTFYLKEYYLVFSIQIVYIFYIILLTFLIFVNKLRVVDIFF
jgi:hypothetical protein